MSGKHVLKVKKNWFSTLAKSKEFEVTEENIIFVPSGVNGRQKWLTNKNFIRVCLLCPVGVTCSHDDSFELAYKKKSHFGFSSWKKMYAVSEMPDAQNRFECRDFFNARFPGRQIVFLGIAFFENFQGPFNLRFRAIGRAGWVTPSVFQTNEVPRKRNQLQYSNVGKLIALSLETGQSTNDKKPSSAFRFVGFVELGRVHPEKDAIIVMQTIQEMDCLRSLSLRESDIKEQMRWGGQHPLNEKESVNCAVQSIRQVEKLEDFEWILDIMFAEKNYKVKYAFKNLCSLETALKQMPPSEFQSLYQSNLGPQEAFKLPPVARRVIEKHGYHPNHPEDLFDDVFTDFYDFFHKHGAKFSRGFFSNANPVDGDVRTAYAALELQYGAGWLEVQKAYRRLLLMYHPDRQSGPKGLGLDEKTSNRKSQEITNALEILKAHLGR
jgi:hypothetical protein